MNTPRRSTTSQVVGAIVDTLTSTVVGHAICMNVCVMGLTLNSQLYSSLICHEKVKYFCCTRALNSKVMMMMGLHKNLQCSQWQRNQSVCSNCSTIEMSKSTVTQAGEVTVAVTVAVVNTLGVTAINAVACHRSHIFMCVCV